VRSAILVTRPGHLVSLACILATTRKTTMAVARAFSFLYNWRLERTPL
jgi:hypothetical protein